METVEDSVIETQTGFQCRRVRERLVALEAHLNDARFRAEQSQKSNYRVNGSPRRLASPYCWKGPKGHDTISRYSRQPGERVSSRTPSHRFQRKFLPPTSR